LTGRPRVPLASAVLASLELALERATEPEVREHRLEIFAARKARRQQRTIPETFAAEEAWSAVRGLAVNELLRRIAEPSAPLILLKGPELAEFYPEPILRTYRDLDVLTDDPERLQQELCARGFQLIGDPRLYEGIHHLRPIAWPGLPLAVELHRAPKWIEPVAPPGFAELRELAFPSRVGIDNVLALPPAAHAVVAAVHSWAHEPLRRLRDLIDVALLLEEADPSEAELLADRWGVGRLWLSTVAACEAFAFRTPLPWPLRPWAQNVATVRQRTVLETHLSRLLAPFASLPPRVALRVVRRSAIREALPKQGESWFQKLTRMRRAVANAFVSRSDHDEALERDVLR
jgi:hypothetical protein